MRLQCPALTESAGRVLFFCYAFSPDNFVPSSPMPSARQQLAVACLPDCYLAVPTVVIEHVGCISQSSFSTKYKHNHHQHTSATFLEYSATSSRTALTLFHHMCHIEQEKLPRQTPCTSQRPIYTVWQTPLGTVCAYLTVQQRCLIYSGPQQPQLAETVAQ